MSHTSGRLQSLRHRLRTAPWPLLAIVALGLALRFWALDWDLPFVTHPDEPYSINGALRMLKTGDLNPHAFDWGSLIFYVNAILYLIFFLLGKLAGFWSSLADLPYVDVETIAVGWVPVPAFYLISRGVVALAGTLSILFVYAIGRDLKGKAAGLVAAFFFAILPTSVAMSHIVKSDTFLVLFCLMSAWGSLRVFRDPRWRNYLLAGAGAGLAVSSKYNAGLILVSLVAAHALRFGKEAGRRWEFAGGALGAAVAFVGTTPFAVFDWPTFSASFLFDAMHYATGHAGAEGDSLVWYSLFLWDQYGLLLLLGIAGILYLLAIRSRPGIVLSVFPVVYFAVVSQFIVHFEATILPIAPFILILAAVFLIAIYEAALPHIRVGPRAATAALAIAVGLLGLPLFQASANYDLTVDRANGHEAARLWIGQNLPAGSRIAIEPYSPYVDHSRYTVEGVDGIIAHSPDWYEQNGFEYLVLSYGTYGRFLEHPSQYPELLDEYKVFFARFKLIARIADGGNEIRVYKTSAALPQQRIAARWGVNAPMVELVGWDGGSGRVGEPLKVVLYWRAIETRRDPLQLTVRLIDRDGHEVTHSEASPFGQANGSDRWPEGIFGIPWEVSLPAAAGPGEYRLQLELNAPALGRLPVLSWERLPISDKLFVGPVKISPQVIPTAELERATQAGVTFGDAIMLRGYSIAERTARPGDSLHLALYWFAQKQVTKGYTVFIHLLDSSGRVRAQVDSQPFQGMYWTSLWNAGEAIRDEYQLELPANLPAGEYKIELGLYEFPSLKRLELADAQGGGLGDSYSLSETIQLGP